MDASQIFELRVSLVGAPFWLVHRTYFDVMHTWIHGLDLVGHSGR